MIGIGTTNGMRAFRSIFGIHQLGSGRLVAFFAVGGVLSYASSADGVTWSAVVRVPGNVSMSVLMALDVRNDVLTLFTGEPTVTTRQYSWSPNLWTATSTVSGGIDDAMGLDARFEGTYYALNYRGVASGTWLHTQTTTGAGFAGPSNALDGFALIQEVTPYNLGGGSVRSASVTGVIWNLGGLYYTLGWSAFRASLVLVSRALGPTAGGVEVVTAMPTEQRWDASIELGGALTIVYLLGTTLYAKRRTGVGIYTDPVPIAGSCSGAFFLVQSPDTGDLIVVYQSDANGHQEINLVIRRGSWGQPIRVAGGDGADHRDPVGGHDVAGGVVRILYTDSDTVQYASIPTDGVPQAPTLLAPLDTGTSLTPLFRSRYNNPMPTDPEAGGEIQVVRQSGGASLWDSALVPDTTPYGGSPLSYDVLYQWRRRDRDTLSGGTGSFGPWASPASFIVRQGGTATILAIAHDGLASSSNQASMNAALRLVGVQRTAAMSAHLAFERTAPQSTALLGTGRRSAAMSTGIGTTLSRTSPMSWVSTQTKTRTAPMTGGLA